MKSQESKTNSRRLSSKPGTTLIFTVIFMVLLNSVKSTTSSSIKARKYLVKNHFQGLPKRTDYEIVEFELPPIKSGEILVKAEWIGLDPYLRPFNQNFPVPYDQFGFQIGKVEESKDPNYPIGTKVVTHTGWQDYSIVNASKVKTDMPLAITWRLPNLKGFSPSIGLGAVGTSGISAYLGLIELCQPKAGETVVVTAAAGSVGSVVGQIAKIIGCKVIGFAGSEQKIQWLENELGFDKAINYKTADIAKELHEAAPNGVDCYFDNVGGEISSIIMSQMNNKGRVAVCGSISTYNEDVLPKATVLQQFIVFKELQIKGFLSSTWIDRWPEAIDQLVEWVNKGLLKSKEHITVGFDEVVDAFIGIFAGENIGKAVVKIS